MTAAGRRASLLGWLGRSRSEPVAAEPVAAEPVAAEPVAAEPVAAEPVAAEPVAAEPVASEPVAAEPVAAEPVASGPVAAEPVAAGPVVPEPATVEPPQPAAEPTVAEASEDAIGIHIDLVLRPDPVSVFLLGWLWDPEQRVERLRLLLDDGQAVDLDPSRFVRRDVLDRYGAAPPTRPGIADCIEFERAAATSCAMRLELQLTDAPARCVAVPPPLTDCPFATKAELVGMLPTLSETEATLGDLQDALSRSLERCAAERRVAADWTHGPTAVQPELSIVVPLYGELDLLESQLTEFARDPEVHKRAELVYVLDQPEQIESLQNLSRELFQLYRVPCRFLALAHNAGFAGATNEGVRHARGDLVLLLNSDVIPMAPGWIGALIDAWRARPDAGLLSPKLVFEDRSLQHAGLYWAPSRLRIHHDPECPVDVEVWKNHQYFKGYPANLRQADVARQVPAVSAACLLTRRDLYQGLGGLDETYVHGDCEDSDLCLRVAAHGLEIWYEPAVELYHLEGQSYPDHTRQLVTIYNNWLQDRRWRAAMVARMAAFPTSA